MAENTIVEDINLKIFKRNLVLPNFDNFNERDIVLQLCKIFILSNCFSAKTPYYQGCVLGCNNALKSQKNQELVELCLLIQEMYSSTTDVANNSITVKKILDSCLKKENKEQNLDFLIYNYVGEEKSNVIKNLFSSYLNDPQSGLVLCSCVEVITQYIIEFFKRLELSDLLKNQKKELNQYISAHDKNLGHGYEVYKKGIKIIYIDEDIIEDQISFFNGEISKYFSLHH